MFDGNRFMKFDRKFGKPLPGNFGSQNIKILARFQTTSRLGREYLWNATSHGQMVTALQTAITCTRTDLIW